MQRIFASFLLLATVAFGQRAFNPADPHGEFKPSLNGLVERLAASDYVVVGTVTKMDAPPTRAYQEQLAEIGTLEKEGRIEEAIEKAKRLVYGISIFQFTVRVESTLCSKSDSPSELSVLAPLGAPTDAGYREELLQPGRRYLFSLVKAQDLDAKVDKFVLDRKQTYYEILNHSDGAVELPSEADNGKVFKPAGYKSDKDIATPILKAATALCQASKPGVSSPIAR